MSRIICFLLFIIQVTLATGQSLKTFSGIDAEAPAHLRWHKADQKHVVSYTDNFGNTNHPEILYWLWDSTTIVNKQYLKDIDKMATQSPFDFVFLTSRFSDGVGFLDTAKMKPYLREAVDYAHKKGIKIGLQIWQLGTRAPHEISMAGYPLKKENTEALIAEGEGLLNNHGVAVIENTAIAARVNKCFASELVKVWLFKKTSAGFYGPSSLVTAESAWVTTKQNKDFSIQISIKAPEKYAGYTAYVTTAHYFDYYDVFSKEHTKVFKKILDAYADIRFDGTGLDEHGAMRVKYSGMWKNGVGMTDRAWSDGFASYYRKENNADPVRLLLDMRYAPDNKPEVRIKAINTYFEARSKGSTMVENFFYHYSKKIFGQKCFAGLHSTFHNVLDGDDIWCTGVNWWDLPREYGQTDETQPMPDRMGVAISGSKPVMYNMFYNKDKYAMYREAINTAPYGVRVHYCGWNDAFGWGKDMHDDDFLDGLKPVEDKIRLLNHFNPVIPKLPVLIIYNFPYIFNWYPDSTQRNINGIRKSDMQDVAKSIWDAGFPCASIPSTWLDRGFISVREDGKVQVKDRVFDAVIFLDPQYAKQTSFSFLKNVLDKKGLLMIRGAATKDFDGNDCTSLFNSLSKRAIQFNIDNITKKLGIAPNPISNGIFLKDGSVVMANYNSIQEQSNTAFSITIAKNKYTGSYQGVFALKVNANGQVEKLACGNFVSLSKNGKTILQTEIPADIFFTRENGQAVIQLKGKSNKILINEN